MSYFEVMTPNVVTHNKFVLGVGWDTLTDEFVFQFEDILNKCAAMEQTNRNLLNVSASIFYPLGLIAPVTARIKTIFQLLCKDKLNWDDLIPQKLASVWNNFLEDLKSLREVRQQRFVFHLNVHSDSRVELLGFCDSSKQVYCAVVYLRLVYKNSVKVFLLAAKTKVVQVGTFGMFVVKLINDKVVRGIRGRIKLNDIFCWSDSEVALCWIRGKKKSWEPWVENRVVAIRKVVERERWNFVKGELNPADIPTRISSNLLECFA